ncbi:MAG: translation elongation factor Ts [Acidimicrobiaceae bacterium]|nr:translation elongation factor Ts [Acidimicrobiaceae bacterium]
MAISAADVQALRRATGAGMMDAKKALEEVGGDQDAAAKLLRERGLAGAAKRDDRENSQGAVALLINPEHTVGAIIELKCETDFVAKSKEFVGLANKLVASVASSSDAPEAVTESFSDEIEALKITLKENIAIGRLTRFATQSPHVIDGYLHIQSERGVQAVLVEIDGGSVELAHDIAVHIGFAKPTYLCREDVPSDIVEAERVTLEAISRNEGKPEAALQKIIEGRLNGFFRQICLIEQDYAKDDKQSVAQILGKHKIIRFSQVIVGA